MLSKKHRNNDIEAGQFCISEHTWWRDNVDHGLSLHPFRDGWEGRVDGSVVLRHLTLIGAALTHAIGAHTTWSSALLAQSTANKKPLKIWNSSNMLWRQKKPWHMNENKSIFDETNFFYQVIFPVTKARSQRGLVLSIVNDRHLL